MPDLAYCQFPPGLPSCGVKRHSRRLLLRRFAVTLPWRLALLPARRAAVRENWRRDPSTGLRTSPSTLLRTSAGVTVSTPTVRAEGGVLDCGEWSRMRGTADAWNFGLCATIPRKLRQARKGATVAGTLRVPRSTRSSSHRFCEVADRVGKERSHSKPFAWRRVDSARKRFGGIPRLARDDRRSEEC